MLKLPKDYGQEISFPGKTKSNSKALKENKEHEHLDNRREHKFITRGGRGGRVDTQRQK